MTRKDFSTIQHMLGMILGVALGTGGLTMTEYLERETAVMRLMQDGCSAKNVQSIMELPAADVAPVRHGRWALNKKYGDYECSECGQGDVKAMDFTNLKMRYCPNCGAKMDGAE